MRIKPYEQIPFWYGVSYRMWEADLTVCHPIPFNLVVSILYKTRLWMRMPTSSKISKGLIRAKHVGYETGYTRGQITGYNLGFSAGHKKGWMDCCDEGIAASHARDAARSKKSGKTPYLDPVTHPERMCT